MSCREPAKKFFPFENSFKTNVLEQAYVYVNCLLYLIAQRM